VRWGCRSGPWLLLVVGRRCEGCVGEMRERACRNDCSGFQVIDDKK
jgi:hypothetical protein